MPHDNDSNREQRDSLQRAAQQAEEATWGGRDPASDRSSTRKARPDLGLDIGAKRDVGSALHDLSVRGRTEGDFIPRGTTTGGGGRYILATMALVCVVALGLLVFLLWLMS